MLVKDFHVHISQRGGTAILSLQGPLTGKNVATFRRACYQAETQENRHCLLDMTDVEEIDGYGLSALVGLLGRRRERNGQVVLYGLNPGLKPRFEATFCDVLFAIRSSLAQAMDLVRVEPST